MTFCRKKGNKFTKTLVDEIFELTCNQVQRKKFKLIQPTFCGSLKVLTFVQFHMKMLQN